MTTHATGRVELRDGVPVLIITRQFRAPIEDVWAAVTEPARLARWIGTYRGDPATGTVLFAMTAEGDAAEDRMDIRECVPPRRLAVTAQVGQGTDRQAWDLELDLVEDGGVTTLTFRQPRPVDADSTGPGWEYYLDRLVAAETGSDVAGVDFERDYFPAMSEHYRRQVAALQA